MIIERFDEVDSTQTLAHARLQTHGREPRAIVTDRQTAGRGTHGRTWHTIPAGSIACTLIWPFTRTAGQMSGLSLVVGMTLATALHPSVLVKWPNDLVIHDQKLGGVLIELIGSPATALIGFGINLKTPTGIDQPASGLDVVASTDRDAALTDVLRALEAALPLFDLGGFAPFANLWPARDALFGRTVRVDDRFQGTAQGVDGLGRLLVKNHEDTLTVSAGHLRLV